MNTGLVKGVLALCCGVSAVALSFKGPSAVAEKVKSARPVAGDSKELVISDPATKADYGIGKYKVEGVLAKGTKVEIFLDDKEVQTLEANTEDGQYDAEVDVKEAGKHVLLAQFKDKKGKDETVKLEFTASDKKFGSENVGENTSVPDVNKEKPVEKVASNNSPKDPEPANVNATEDSNADPNSPSNRRAGGVNNKLLKPNVKPTEPKKPPVKAAAKATFVISSHTNFNVVPHGIIKIGGKGTPGDKVMLLVDNKPSMRGTVKPDGRWTFPVKVAKPGFRKITAQDLTSREAKVVKLKIK
jgi:hypothetical protein